MSFTVENVEFYMAIFIRMSGFIYAAPIFNSKDIPIRMKFAIAFFISVVICSVLPYNRLEYSGIVGFAGLIIKELFVGLSIGYFADICMAVLSFAGQIIDMDIGFSMVQEMDPTTNINTTITSHLYNRFVILIFLISNMHHYLIKAIVQTYTLIPLGYVKFPTNIYRIMIKFITDFFIIGFRIALPIFATLLLVNVVLAVLAKVAQQMNMFVVGMQLKLLIGLTVLFIIMGLIPTVADMVASAMKEYVKLIVQSLAG